MSVDRLSLRLHLTMALRGFMGSLLLAASFIVGAHCSPDQFANRKNLLQTSSQLPARNLAGSLSAEESQMFAEIWAKYSSGGFMTFEQLTSLFRATDHELGDQVFNEKDWLDLCKEKGADPSKGLSKQDLLSMYFDDRTHPESSIKKDYTRIFAQGGTPPPPAQDERKNLLQKGNQQVHLVSPPSTEDTRMFNEIWAKYAHGDFMSLEELNALLHDTDHEYGEQVVSDSWWQSLCKKEGADPSKGLSKQNLLSVYFTQNVGSSIKKDYIRIFVEGAPPKADTRENLQKNPELLVV